MNEFGESPSIYVWPVDHEDGTSFPDDFNERLGNALAEAGIEWEWT
jgi:hypothetical protein